MTSHVPSISIVGRLCIPSNRHCIALPAASLVHCRHRPWASSLTSRGLCSAGRGLQPSASLVCFRCNLVAHDSGPVEAPGAESFWAATCPGPLLQFGRLALGFDLSRRLGTPRACALSLSVRRFRRRPPVRAGGSRGRSQRGGATARRLIEFARLPSSGHRHRGHSRPPCTAGCWQRTACGLVRGPCVEEVAGGQRLLWRPHQLLLGASKGAPLLLPAERSARGSPCGVSIVSYSVSCESLR